MSESPLLDADEAAAYLHTTRRHIQLLWDRRQLPAIKVGRLVRFHKDDLNTYIEENRMGKTSA